MSDNIKQHPRSRVVDSDANGNPVYSTNGPAPNKQDVARVLELWAQHRQLTTAEISRRLNIPQYRVSRYMSLTLFKQLSDDTAIIRIKSNV